MKKIFFVISVVCCFCLTAFSQKKGLGVSDFKQWRSIGGETLSNDGMYIAYYISGDLDFNKLALYVKPVTELWCKRFDDARSLAFSEDSKFLMYLAKGRDLVLFNLYDTTSVIIPNVSKFSTYKGKYGSCVAYIQNNGDTSSLVLINISSKMSKRFKGVSDYQITGNENRIFFTQVIDSSVFSINIVDLMTWKQEEVFRGIEPLSVTADRNGDQLIFLVERDSGAKVVWYYKRNKFKKANAVNPVLDVKPGVSIESFTGFSDDGEVAFCNLVDSLNEEKDSDVKIYSYLDTELINHKFRAGGKLSYLGVFNLERSHILQMQQEGEPAISPDFSVSKQLSIGTVTRFRAEWNWNAKAIPICWMLNYKDGSRKVISRPIDRNADSYVLAPSEHWVVYFNSDDQNYYSLNLSTGNRKSITKGIDAKWTTYDNDDIPISRFRNIGLAGFTSDSRFVYLYSQFDIFKVDIEGKEPPVNLTKGIGKRNKIVFRFLFRPKEWKGDTVFLSAFDRVSKKDGFFKLYGKKLDKIKLVYMEDAVFTGPEESKYFARHMPRKARDASVFVLRKMKADSSQNIYVTNDFSSFRAVSHVYPEKEFNWYTTELIDFKTRDGKNTQGILYKPENFNPKFKYPVIFFYYEKMSECLNKCIDPDVCAGPMNIPYFVSNGYLVFTPDIHFDIGYPGRSSYDCIMGAADRMITFPYVDSTKMGLQGHSFGGFQTNYIVTHTNRFAAACSASGFTDFISAYGSIHHAGTRQGQYELYRDRIGATLWERPDLYIENSPVFLIDRVRTPMLLMHNMEDSDVPVGQGIEFFTGLRRLGKVAYLLQYKGGDHSLWGEAAEDYSVRMMDFFNYYLKGMELPAWMSNQEAKILDFKL